ncbi:MAG: glycosyltransferase [Verrucomicrobiota bacterium]
MHDFHPVCPSHNLFNADSRYCGVPDDPNVCNACLKSNPHSQSTIKDILQWRELWASVLVNINEIRCFSEDSAVHFKKAYPELSDSVVVIPHDRRVVPGDFGGDLQRRKTEKDGTPTVAVIGNISPAKGAPVVDLLAGETDLELVVVGKVPPNEGWDFPGVTVHGPYEVGDLPKLLSEYEADLILIPSLWPETYNFVADEAMSMDLPILSFDIGAHAARLREYHTAKLIPLELSDDSEALDREIRSFHASLVDRKKAVDEAS